MRDPAKVVKGQPFRGFKSHRLRVTRPVGLLTSTNTGRGRRAFSFRPEEVGARRAGSPVHGHAVRRRLGALRVTGGTRRRPARPGPVPGRGATLPGGAARDVRAVAFGPWSSIARRPPTTPGRPRAFAAREWRDVPDTRGVSRQNSPLGEPSAGRWVGPATRGAGSGEGGRRLRSGEGGGRAPALGVRGPAGWASGGRTGRGPATVSGGLCRTRAACLGRTLHSGEPRPGRWVGAATRGARRGSEAPLGPGEGGEPRPRGAGSGGLGSWGANGAGPATVSGGLCRTRAACLGRTLHSGEPSEGRRVGPATRGGGGRGDGSDPPLGEPGARAGGVRRAGCRGGRSGRGPRPSARRRRA